MTIQFIKYGFERKCMEKENITKLTDEEKVKAEKNFLQLQSVLIQSIPEETLLPLVDFDS